MAEQATTVPCSQPPEALVTRMFEAAAYPHPAADLQMIETHLSWVFLAGDFAYKVRKPIKLDFVDFSTLRARQIDCEEECRLNRRLAPSLYLGVVPISYDPVTGAICVNGQGTPCEYAVCMRRFAQQDVLAALAHDGRLCPAEIDALADLIADFHATAPVARAGSDAGTPASIRCTLEDCATGVVALSTEPQIAATTVSLIRQHASRLEDTFSSRLRCQHIRECHGDLHLGNIVLINGRPTPFDCLEFSPSLRWIDTMYDTAFLFMDLLAAGLRGLAYRLINRYLERCGDYDGLTVLPFYASMRALVRARVLLERAHQLDGTPDLAAKPSGEARRMLDLSRELLCRNDACILLMHGLSGSGKSTRAAQLAEAEGMIRVRSDVERQRGWHVRAADRYLPRAVERTYRRLAAICKLGAGTGFPMIADATFLSEHHRQRFFSLGRRLGVAVAIADCVADVDTLRMRIRNRMRGGLDASEADLHVLEAQIATQQPLNVEERAHVIPGETSPVVPYMRGEEGNDFARAGSGNQVP
ncbi:AAA family ATPase [Ralstonia sp. CHL-2022]|uniref:AAA family ATPase n=1 Tax=Ralstonia mojiangensis TaxID=2953895 RepID=A0AAE3I895_9RALS|nr:bifunctional aminoglycoside phosphotransferase/ATP-binding protein [Ralstonia mojiangensis]MCT7318731.1 AAA family ATPase [Ralstonia mojiangensis]